jgi:hypothetical protein
MKNWLLAESGCLVFAVAIVKFKCFNAAESEVNKCILNCRNVVHIRNKYGYVVTWIRFEDSLRLFTLSSTE